MTEEQPTMIKFAKGDETTGPIEAAEKPVDVLMRLAAAARMYRSSDGTLHAQVPVGDRFEAVRLKSPGFRNWLIDGYFADCGQPPSSWAVERVVSLLEARAWFDRGRPSVFIRVGRDPGGDDLAHTIDLGDGTGRAIWICAEGWVVVDKTEIPFSRPGGLLPLPTPVSAGSIDLLRPYVNVTDADFRLLVAWLTASLRPVGPYPILVLYGEQGSAKSTLARILRLLIDPQDCALLAEPKSTRDLMVTAANGWLLAFDNVSAIDDRLSDSFCRLVSGGGFATRALFTNDERTVISAQRPVILNGIEEFVVRGDLIDRCVFLHLPTIPPAFRRCEESFWQAFKADYAQIFGGVLDVLAGGLRELPAVNLPELPRMADYARWGEAVGRALGWAPDAFLSTYLSNRRHATVPALLDSALATTLFQLGRELEGPRWQGWSPSVLFDELTQFVEERDARAVGHLSAAQARKKQLASAAGWPRNAQAFSKELRRVAPQLRLHGLAIHFERDNQGRHVVFTNLEPKSGD
jgi:hypothetical protein